MAISPHESDRLAAVRTTALMDGAVEEAFDRLAGLAKLILDTPLALVTVVDEHRCFWVSAQGTDPAGPRESTRIDSFCQHVVETREALVLGDVRLDARTRDLPSVEELGVRAWAGYPVHSPDGQVLGTLSVLDTVVRSWTDTELQVLEGLAATVTREVALRATARAAEQARAREQLLSRIGELLTAGLDLPAVWRAIAHLAVPALADVAFVHSITPHTGLQVQYVLHRDPARQAQTQALITDLPRRLDDAVGPGRVAATGTTQVLTDMATVTAHLTPGQLYTRDALRARSSVSVPLRARGQLIGVLTVIRVGSSPRYTDAEVQLVEAISARAALALDNALAYSQQRSSSLALQQALLPRLLPQHGPLQLASRYLPAGSGQVVGGDWYDAFIDRQGTTTLVIGDVAGHDIDAAATMGQLRAMLRMAGHDGSLSPAGILTAVDTATEDLGTSVFTTALVGRVQGARQDGPQSLTVSWSSAGHPPPVLLGADGTVHQPDVRADRALGLDVGPADGRRVVRADHTLQVASGDTVLLYTDGLVERRDQDLDRGTARLRAQLPALARLPLEELCDAVLARMQPDSTDDVALLALRSHLSGRPDA